LKEQKMTTRLILLCILVNLGIYSTLLALNAYALPNQPSLSKTRTESYASIVNRSPEKAWKNFVKAIAQKPEIIALVDQTLEQIKPIIQFVDPEKINKVISIRNRIHVTPGNWEKHIMAIGNMATEAGSGLVVNKNLGNLLHQLSTASEKADYISALTGIVYFFFISKNDPDLALVENKWKKVESPIKKYLKNSKVLQD
jgi:hypothetical protein